MEKAGLASEVSHLLRNGNSRQKRDADSTLGSADLEVMLSNPVNIVVNTSMTRVKDKKQILTLLKSQKHATTETYKLFGEGKPKFRVSHHDNKLFLSFQHKVVKSRTYKLVLMIKDGPNLGDLLLLAIHITVIP